jgi:hypothetical protein
MGLGAKGGTQLGRTDSTVEGRPSPPEGVCSVFVESRPDRKDAQRNFRPVPFHWQLDLYQKVSSQAAVWWKAGDDEQGIQFRQGCSIIVAS